MATKGESVPVSSSGTSVAEAWGFFPLWNGLSAVAVMLFAVLAAAAAVLGQSALALSFLLMTLVRVAHIGLDLAFLCSFATRQEVVGFMDGAPSGEQFSYYQGSSITAPATVLGLVAAFSESDISPAAKVGVVSLVLSIVAGAFLVSAYHLIQVRLVMPIRVLLALNVYTMAFGLSAIGFDLVV